MTSWLEKAREWGANAFYADTLGGVYWGDPATMMGLFTSGFLPQDLAMERIVDIYPRAGILSGGVIGYSWMCGAPGKKPEEWPITAYAVSTPRFPLAGRRGKLEAFQRKRGGVL